MSVLPGGPLLFDVHTMAASSYRMTQRFRYFDGQAEWSWRPEPGSASITARAVAPLGAIIMGFESNENGTLVVNFSNGYTTSVNQNYVNRLGRK